MSYRGGQKLRLGIVGSPRGIVISHFRDIERRPERVLRFLSRDVFRPEQKKESDISIRDIAK